MEEARRLYVEQSRLAERLRLQAGEGPQPAPLVLWDVGLGAAANAMAAIQCFEEAAAFHPVRPLRLVSFENDLDSLRLACENAGSFPYLRHPAPAAIFEHRQWQSAEYPGLSWQLLSGDFLERMRDAAEPPAIIFYDMFSTKTCGDLWTLAAFGRLYAACRGEASELFTYTCSTANRAALLAAGFHVARGRSSGEKVETTIALTPAAARGPWNAGREMLPPEWLAKWGRSGARFPADISPQGHEEFARRILGHEQFR